MNRIVVLRALGLGDLLTAVPALRALRTTYPSARIRLAGPAALAPLALLTGAVDEVVDTAALSPLDDALASADLAVNLHGRGPQSTQLLAATRPHRLVAFGLDGRVWRATEHEARRWCRLLTESGIPADPGDLDLPRPPVGSAAPGAVVLHPGAASASRRWPVERWAEVARVLAGDGRHVVISGGPSETELAAEVVRRARLPPEASLAGRTGVLALAALVADASLLIAGDTGVAHLATAYRTPSVLLFGPTPPALWGPPADRSDHTVLWSGGTGDPHGAATDPGLLRITVAQVLAAARPPLPAQPLEVHAVGHEPVATPGEPVAGEDRH